MPVFNTARYLPACLNSIQEQTTDNWELIAVNDHSGDESLPILREYAKKDPRIHVFENPGNGIIPALREAFAKSSGGMITRMDSDDIMNQDKLELLQNKLKAHGKGHVAVGLVDYFSDSSLGEGYLKYADWINELAKEGRSFDEIYKECVIPSPAWMMYREDLKSIGGFSRDVYPEDYDLTFRKYAAGMKVAATSRAVHQWRDHSGRASRNDQNYSDNSFVPLKVHWFKRLDYDGAMELFLWGAGSRGKKIADQLIRNKISFRWLSDNPKKIGKQIYGVEIETFDRDLLHPDTQLINSVAALEASEEIELIQSVMKERFFAFC